jgi:hypothetical protein
LSGQGSKLFSLSAAIADAFRKQRIITNFQETAVIRGLGEYLKLLTRASGSKVLLLDPFPRAYALSCASIRYEERSSEDGGGKIKIPAFSADRSEALARVTVLGPDTTVPTRKAVRCDVLSPEEGATFTVEEYFVGTSLIDEIMAIRIVPMAQGSQLEELQVDVNVDHTAVLSLLFEDGWQEHFQLNNQYKISFDCVPAPGDVEYRCAVSGGLRVKKAHVPKRLNRLTSSR